jgi:hypothetical protein
MDHPERQRAGDCSGLGRNRTEKESPGIPCKPNRTYIGRIQPETASALPAVGRNEAEIPIAGCGESTHQPNISDWDTQSRRNPTGGHTMINAYAASEPGGELKPFAYDPGPMGPGEVELEVQYCGICHSDLSMLDKAWTAAYPDGYVGPTFPPNPVPALHPDRARLRCG